MLIFSLFTEIFIYEKWRPKEANGPEGLYISLTEWWLVQMWQDKDKRDLD